MAQKICLIIGAGCTVSDTSERNQKQRPPLDKGFFSMANKTNAAMVSKIKSYLEKMYGIDILKPGNDSLEGAMAKIYTDIFDPNLKDSAIVVFRTLISLFNRRLGDTTNNLPATNRRFLYRIISNFLKSNVRPDDITIITFNQDIQIEKILNKMEHTQTYRKFGHVFDFPSCYQIWFDKVTFPKHGKMLFDLGDGNPKGVKILKLHGSLNWYSLHKSQKISPKAMFKEDRPIYVTRRQRIDIQMRYTLGSRSRHTIPVIIPPVTHKSGILHNHIKPLWNMAEKALENANEVVIFGYSCPTMDFESSNLIQRSLKRGTYEVLWVIDPDPLVLTRYIELIRPAEITYYPSGTDYLGRRK